MPAYALVGGRTRSVGADLPMLIGKDGGEKLRRSNPLPSRSLEETIDAMTMRRNGER